MIRLTRRRKAEPVEVYLGLLVELQVLSDQVQRLGKATQVSHRIYADLTEDYL